MGGRADARWQAAVREHEEALGRFAESAERIGQHEWQTPRAQGSWSPAQVVEHLALAYEALLRELGGGTPMTARAPAWQQRLLRCILLPHILFHRSIPGGARAPRETRPPEDHGASRDEGLRRLQRLGEQLQKRLGEVRGAGAGHLTHPYFGRIPPPSVLRFCAVHLEHHRRQISH